MKQRAMQKALSTRQAIINEKKRKSELALSRALSTEEISRAHENYVNLCFASAISGANEKSLSVALDEYREALKKHGFKETDFETKPLCDKCNDSGVVNGNICECIWSGYINALKAECDIERKAPFTFEECNLSVIKDKDQRNTLENLYFFMKKYAEQLPDVYNINIVLSGGVGTGKTCIASAVARRAVERGKSCKFMSAYEFNSNMLACHTSPVAERNGRLHDYLTADLLVIDDLGTEPFLRNVTEEYLLLVLEERQNAHLCTVITTNLSAEKILERYHERIYSRISHKQNSMFFVLEGDDLRHN